MHSRSDIKRWLVAGSLAALLILLGVALIVPQLIPEPGSSPRRVTPIRVVFEDLPPPEPPERVRQVVSIDAPETEEAPEDADFEDRVNRRVEEETVARSAGAMGDLPTPEPEDSVEEREARRERRERRRQAERRRQEEEAESQEEADEAVAVVEEDTRRTSRVPPVEEEEAIPEEYDLSAFNPTLERAADFIAVPGAGQIDHLDLPEDARTQLNSIENLYWSYWDRLKSQVRPHWRPGTVYRRQDPSGRIFGVEDRYTVLRVTLNGDGSLRHIYLERSSDLDFLDQEAVRAVRAAQPFANVPEGLKDERGLLSFRFGFYFEVSSRHFRIRREDW